MTGEKNDNLFPYLKTDIEME